LAARPEFQPRVHLVIDGSGVGVAVCEMFKTALRGQSGVTAHTISITGGRSWSFVGQRSYNVAKIEIIGAVREVLESRRLKVARDRTGEPIEFADVLKRELQDFRVKITTAANEQFEARSGAHDDLVLCVALPIWLGSQRHMAMSTLPDEGPDNLRPRERASISAEAAALEAAETAALKDEAERVTREREEERDREHQRKLDTFDDSLAGWTNFNGSAYRDDDD